MVLRVKGQSVAEALRVGRDTANLSQKEMAALLGVSSRTVQYWEAGKVPQPRHRRAIVAFLQGLETAA
jgi:DNA-binding transcriptional regulator YiaG